MTGENTNDARLAQKAAQLAYANSIGIDAEFINNLVDEFYARVRKDPDIGPIFENHVKDWGQHLYKLKHFWASVCLSSGTYSGRPLPVHIEITEIKQHHFPIWLKIFNETLNDLCTNKAAVDFFMERANRIAHSFMLAMFTRE